MQNIIIKGSQIYADEIAKSFIDEFGKQESRELMDEDYLPKFLKKNYDGIKFTLSEVDEIEEEINKVLSKKKKKKGTLETKGENMSEINEVGKDAPMGYDTFIKTPNIMKLESQGPYILYKTMPGKVADPNVLEQLKSKFTDAKLFGSFFKFFPEGFVIKKESVVAVDKILEDMKVMEFIKGEINEEELANLHVQSTKKISVTIPPKPTDVAPEGFEYALDTDTNTWVVIKKKSSLDFNALGIISSKQVKAEDLWPTQRQKSTTGYTSGWEAAPMGTFEASEDTNTNQPNEDDKVKFSVGVKIEYEHAPTHAKILEHVNKTGKFTMTVEDLATLIATDHINEACGYMYYDNEKGLPAMEKSLGCK